MEPPTGEPHGRSPSFAFVMFRTVAEAEVAASGTILVGGKPTAVAMAGVASHPHLLALLGLVQSRPPGGDWFAFSAS